VVPVTAGAVRYYVTQHMVMLRAVGIWSLGVAIAYFMI
jgi:hypothetical protein